MSLRVLLSATRTTAMTASVSPRSLTDFRKLVKSKCVSGFEVIFENVPPSFLPSQSPAVFPSPKKDKKEKTSDNIRGKEDERVHSTPPGDCCKIYTHDVMCVSAVLSPIPHTPVRILKWYTRNIPGPTVSREWEGVG